MMSKIKQCGVYLSTQLLPVLKYRNQHSLRGRPATENRI